MFPQTGEILFAMQRRRVALRGDVATAIGTMSISADRPPPHKNLSNFTATFWGSAFLKVVTGEGLIRSLDPSFDIVTQSIPYFVRSTSSFA